MTLLTQLQSNVHNAVSNSFQTTARLTGDGISLTGRLVGSIGDTSSKAVNQLIQYSDTAATVAANTIGGIISQVPTAVNVLNVGDLNPFNIPQTIAQLAGDGVAIIGRVSGGIVEAPFKTLNNLAHKTGATDATNNSISDTGRNVGDSVHDVFLAISAAFWLGGRIPTNIVRALGNHTAPLEEFYLYDIENIKSLISQGGLSLACVTPLPLLKSLANELMDRGQPTLITTPMKSRPHRPQFSNESWYFINGVATDENWLRKNCEYLEARFQQPVTGIHNHSSGLPTDLTQCIVHRNFHIVTRSVSDVVDTIIDALDLNPNPNSIVRILAHSQGTLILNLSLEILHQRRITQMHRLKIHTFAACSKDFQHHGYMVLEHYANLNDAVSKLGVLDARYRHRYLGNIYVHNGASGHLFNTSYSLNAADYQPQSTPPDLLSIPLLY